MKLHCDITIEEYVKAAYLSRRPRLWLRVVMRLVAIAYVIFAAIMTWSWISTGVGDFSNWLTLGIGPYFAVVYFVIIPSFAKKQYRQIKGPKEHDAEIQPDAVRFISARGEVTIPFVELHKWKMNQDMVLIYHSDMLSHMLLRRWFSSQDDFDLFVGYLKAALGPEKS